MRRWVLLIFVILLLGFAAAAGRVLIVDAPRRSDVIVVLAGETDRRPALGIDLLRQGYGSIMLLDVPAAAKLYDTTQLELAQKYVAQLAQASAIRICPIVGLSTREEAHDVERCLANEQGNRVLIVTSDFHTRRALSIFRHELKGKTFSVAAVRDNTGFGERWWTRRQWAKTCLDEWIRMAWWKGLEEWR
jgi:uncharacterized SAM-binding protein YcdF (DUF218 family)